MTVWQDLTVSQRPDGEAGADDRPGEVVVQRAAPLDEICWRYYGYTAGAVEAVLGLNPELAEHGRRIAVGTRVRMPVLTRPGEQVIEPRRAFS